MTTTVTKGRIPSLDGLRGVSISLVIASHVLTNFLKDPWTEKRFHPLASAMGVFGVNVFFVISGFLITTLLLAERKKTGTVSLRNFYRRRAVRILPVALLYIAVIAVIAHPSSLQLIYALTFSTSFFFSKANIGLQQLWSLSVEEQFYLFWPVAFLFSEAWLKRFAFAILMVTPLLRVTLRLCGFQNFWHAGPAIADTLMAGCLLAIYRDEVTRFTERWITKLPVFTGIWLFAVLLLFVFHGGYATSILWFLEPVAIALGIAAAIQRRDPVLNRGLLVWIGLLSYSLYLWQQPFLALRGGPSVTLVTRLIAVLLTAVASYKFIEQPTLRMANRRRAGLQLHPVRTEAT